LKGVKSFAAFGDFLDILFHHINGFIDSFLNLSGFVASTSLVSCRG
jgi:hypothetical protein